MQVYGAVHSFAISDLPRRGIIVTTSAAATAPAIIACITPSTKLVMFESPSNPLTSCIDIRSVADAAHAVGALVVVDNTFASPILQKPLTLAADVVVQSATKYLNGHSDVMAGVVCSSHAFIASLRAHQIIHGATLSGRDASLLERGLCTLALRVRAQSSSALALAVFFSEHPRVASVLYPGLQTHPHHAVAGCCADA